MRRIRITICDACDKQKMINELWKCEMENVMIRSRKILSASWQEFNEFMSAYSDKPYMTNIKIKTSWGAVHKVCHAPEGGGGLRKCDSLWQGGKDHVTSHFPFFHNSQFLRFILYFIMHNTNLSCNYHLRNCKKLNLCKGIS